MDPAEIVKFLKAADKETRDSVMTGIGAVTLDRFNEKVTERNQLKTELDRAAAAAGMADGFRAQVEDLSTKLAAADSRYLAHSTITGVTGLTDPSIVRTIEALYGELDPKSRPSLADVLTTWRAEPEKAPGVIRPHLAPHVAAPAPAPASGQPGPITRPPDPNLGVVAVPAPGAVALSATQIGALTPEQYKAHRETLKASWGNGR